MCARTRRCVHTHACVCVCVCVCMCVCVCVSVYMEHVNYYTSITVSNDTKPLFINIIPAIQSLVIDWAQNPTLCPLDALPQFLLCLQPPPLHPLYLSHPNPSLFFAIACGKMCAYYNTQQYITCSVMDRSNTIVHVIRYMYLVFQVSSGMHHCM